jgi:hypothetical protein
VGEGERVQPVEGLDRRVRGRQDLLERRHRRVAGHGAVPGRGADADAVAVVEGGEVGERAGERFLGGGHLGGVDGREQVGEVPAGEDLGSVGQRHRLIITPACAPRRFPRRAVEVCGRAA